MGVESSALKIWLNGKVVGENEAKISILDSSIQHGIGIFETMYARQTEIFRLDEHLAQLEYSAKNLNLATAIRKDLISNALDELLVSANLSESRIKLTITGGTMNRLRATKNKASSPTIIIECQPATKYPEKFFTDGITVAISQWRENPDLPTAGHKSIDYWSRIRALQEASLVNAGESIWLTPDAFVASGSVSNVFLITNKIVYTPPALDLQNPSIKSCVRPGITRNCIINIAKQSGLTMNISPITITDFLNADECFLTNSGWGVLPVVKVALRTSNSKKEGGIENRFFGNGIPGSETIKIRKKWIECVNREIGTIPK